MDELGIGTAMETAAEFAPQPKKKLKPGLAFGMSLLVPGSGQVYCGKNRGWITMGFFAAAVTLAVVAVSPAFSGMGFRAAIVLYGFSFLDAFYSAREVNEGIDDWVDNANPRIAAVLNLVTTGFGYFYLGHRGIGITIFIGLKLFNPGIVGDHPQVATAMSVLLEIVLVVLAIHGWKLAHDELKIKNSWTAAEGKAEIEMPAVHEGMSAALPLTLGIFLVMNYVALVVIGVTMPQYKKIDQSATVLKTLDDGTQTLRNPKYGFGVSIAPEWVLDYKTDPKTFFHAQGQGGACEFTVMPVAELLGTGSDGRAFLVEMRKLYPKTQMLSEHEDHLDGRPSHVTVLGIEVQNTKMRQRYTTVRKGMTTYVVIETAPAAWAICDTALENMVNSVRFE